MQHSKIPVFVLAAAMSTSTLVVADNHDDEEIPFDEFNLFNELNNTDGDLGIHFVLDGDPWKSIEIEGPDGRRERALIEVKTRGPLRRQGGTELAFESAEPEFEEQSPEEFFARFPEGIYEAEGIGLEGEELESESLYTHTMPAPADGVKVSGTLTNLEGECADDADVPFVSVSKPIVISWNQVELSHPVIGNTNLPIEIETYVLVVEDDEGDAVLSILIPADEEADSYSFTIPDDYIEITNVWKFEIIATEAEGGNATAVESCFGVI